MKKKYRDEFFTPPEADEFLDSVKNGFSNPKALSLFNGQVHSISLPIALRSNGYETIHV